MTTLECQVLEALYRLTRCGHKPFDTSVLEEGQRVFGKGWLEEAVYGEKCGTYYAPQTSLVLGRLVKKGLVAKHPQSGESYSYWELTDKGREYARGMLSS